jgi:hypothetical protein
MQFLNIVFNAKGCIPNFQNFLSLHIFAQSLAEQKRRPENF